MVPRRARRWLVVLGATLGMRCSERASLEDPAPSAQDGRPGAFYFFGCRAVLRGGDCEIELGDTLTLWRQARSEERGQVWLGEQQVVAASQAVEGGVQYRVDVDRLGRLEWRDASGRPLGHLRLVAPVVLDGVKRADDLRRAGRNDEALVLIAQEGRAADAHTARRAQALRARVAIAQGDFTQAVALLEQTSRDSWSDGHVSDALQDAFALVHVLCERMSLLSRAEAWLAEVRPWLAEAPGYEVGYSYYSAAVSRRLGYLEVAQRQFRDAYRLARALGDRSKQRDSAAVLATLLADFGRLQQATELLQVELDASQGQSPCVLGQLHFSLAWMGMQSGFPGLTPADVSEHWRQAVALDKQCPLAADVANTLANWGVWSAQVGSWQEAQQASAELTLLKSPRTGVSELWEQELRGRLALHEGKRAFAQRLFERAASDAERLGRHGEQQRALLAQGDAQWARGQRRQAIESYQQAGRVMEAVPGLPDLGSARSSFIANRDGAARRLVGAYLALGETGNAFDAAFRQYVRAMGRLALPARLESLTGEARRRWQERVSRYIELRGRVDQLSHEHWSLSRDALTLQRAESQRLAEAADAELKAALREVQPAARTVPIQEESDELLVILFPSSDRWWGLARWHGRVLAHSLGELTEPLRPEAFAGWLVRELAGELPQSRRLALMPYGDAAGLDHGQALAAALGAGRPAPPIVYRLGLAISPRPIRESALVVVDPTRDLPAARREGSIVTEALAQRALLARPSSAGSLNVLSLEGEQATREAVLAGLGQVGFFHYAGHARALEDDSLTGLMLAGGTRLSAADVLALDDPPREVVLSSCDAALSLGPGTGWSLAHAFVLSGSAVVIAPVARVEDGVTARLQSHLYSALVENRELPLPDALARAQAAARVEGWPGNWSAFRAFVP